MAYYIDLKNNSVFSSLTQPSDLSSMERIDSSLARQCGLSFGQRLTDAQIAALRIGTIQAFQAASGNPLPLADPDVAPGRGTEVAVPSVADVPARATTSWVSIPPSVTRASTAAGIVEAFAWVILVLGVILGIAVALQTDYDVNGDKVHPYVGLGIGLAIGVAINCLMIIMVAAYIKAKMELAQRAG
jgi:hypothetical protein